MPRLTLCLKASAKSRATGHFSRSVFVLSTFFRRLLLSAAAPVIAFFPHLLVLVREPLEFVVGQVLDVNHLVLRLVDRFNDLIELEVNRARIPVLRILDQEYDQKCDDSRAGIDNELPGIGIVEVRTCNEPKRDCSEGGEERPFGSHPVSRLCRKNMKTFFSAIFIARHTQLLRKAGYPRKWRNPRSNPSTCLPKPEFRGKAHLSN
jgi:hypothetical protein